MEGGSTPEIADVSFESLSPTIDVGANNERAFRFRDRLEAGDAAIVECGASVGCPRCFGRAPSEPRACNVGGAAHVDHPLAYTEFCRQVCRHGPMPAPTECRVEDRHPPRSDDRTGAIEQCRIGPLYRIGRVEPLIGKSANPARWGESRELLAHPVRGDHHTAELFGECLCNRALAGTHDTADQHQKSRRLSPHHFCCELQMAAGARGGSNSLSRVDVCIDAHDRGDLRTNQCSVGDEIVDDAVEVEIVSFARVGAQEAFRKEPLIAIPQIHGGKCHF